MVRRSVGCNAHTEGKKVWKMLQGKSGETTEPPGSLEKLTAARFVWGEGGEF